MSESAIWPFLFGMISVYPFFPLRHVPIMGRLKIPFSRLMFYASLIMIVQGFSYLLMSNVFPFDGIALAWHRKLFMIPYVLLTLAFSKDSIDKTLFMDFFMVGIVMVVIDLAYIIERTWFAESFAIAPHRTDVLVRLALTLLIYPPLYILFKKNLKPIMNIASVTVWRYMTAIPFVFAIISIITTMEAFDHNISIVILLIRFSVISGSVLVCYLLAVVVKQLEQSVILQEKSKQSERLLALQSAQYEGLTKNIEQTRAFRHDLRHHLSAISTMTKRKEFDKLLDYLEHYRKSVPTDKDMVLCENYAANSVISHYFALAKEQEINELNFRCSLANNSGIDDVDLCVLLGNLLENAIEGCMTIPKEDRKIKLRIAGHAGELLITLDNTFDGIVVTANGEYLSRKRAVSQRGFGLTSVATVTEKYDGEISYEQKDGWFMVSINLKQDNLNPDQYSPPNNL